MQAWSLAPSGGRCIKDAHAGNLISAAVTIPGADIDAAPSALFFGPNQRRENPCSATDSAPRTAPEARRKPVVARDIY
jgi:hypothetical protein